MMLNSLDCSSINKAYTVYLRIQKYLDDESEDLKNDVTAFKLYAKIIYLCKETGCCHLPTRELARLSGISNGAVSEKLEKLVRAGYLRRPPARKETGTRESRPISLPPLTMQGGENDDEAYVLIAKRAFDQDYLALADADATLMHIGEKTIRVILQEVSDNESDLAPPHQFSKAALAQLEQKEERHRRRARSPQEVLLSVLH